VIEGNAMMLVRPRNEQFAYKYSVSRIKPPFASMLRRKIDHCEASGMIRARRSRRGS